MRIGAIAGRNIDAAGPNNKLVDKRIRARRNNGRDPDLDKYTRPAIYSRNEAIHLLQPVSHILNQGVCSCGRIEDTANFLDGLQQ